MPYNFPFFGFPGFRNTYYQNTNPNFELKKNKNTSSDSFYYKEPEEVQNRSSFDNNFFNFLGLNLQSDDLLILGILFFLYKEGCDDIYLYIALFLLLIN